MISIDNQSSCVWKEDDCIFANAIREDLVYLLNYFGTEGIIYKTFDGWWFGLGRKRCIFRSLGTNTVSLIRSSNIINTISLLDGIESYLS